MSDIKLWLQSIGLEKYGEICANHDIDLQVAPDLTEQDLEKLGVSLGHRRKFIAAAAKLRARSAAPANPPAQAQTSGFIAQQVERRQVTVVFTDLVGSTALASQLDPEDMSRLLATYQQACTSVIGRYDGFIAQYLGDGVLAYFGYPQAQEHAAERAVRVGLDIVNEIGRLLRPDGQPLQARVGIATGRVATAELSGAGTSHEQTVVGDTPNLAARLQAFADPGCVLVSPTTHRLTGDFFEYLFVGEHEVRGFPQPVPMWRVLGESATESRFAAARAAVAGPIVARERELAFLSDAWQRATQGDGHVLLVCGEAGMGKSRLLEALVERVRPEPHRLLRCQCSPYHRYSVLYPFSRLLRHWADLRSDRSRDENLQRIERMLNRIGRSSRAERLLIAELLEIPAGDSLSSMEMTPAQRKSETLAILEDFLLAPLDGATVLLLLEDAHWSDPTTQTLVERLLKRIGRARALVLITYRPEFKTTWADHPQATAISCKQLATEQCAAMVRHVASQRQMDETLVQEIVARSDGVPLYVEELTKAVLELQSVRAGAVPMTLQDSLMARLDRLGGAKDVAQIASVIGRQFSYPLLAAIAGIGDEELRTALGRLQDSGLIFAAGEADESGYSFNHSLVQEAAYESLSRNRRQSLHEKIARTLEQRPAAAGDSEPAVIAHHFSRAHDPAKSFDFWMLAADKAAQRSAYAESIVNLNSALAEAELIPNAGLRARGQLDAMLKLGATYVIQSGPHSDQVESVLTQAHGLAKEIDAGPQLFQATWGLYLNAASSRRFDKAQVRGDELTAISQRLADEDLQFESLHHRWGFAYFTGQTARLLEYSQEGMNRYDAARHHRFSDVFGGHDPGVCAHCNHAIALALSGRSKDIRSHGDTAVALAESLQHPVTLAFGLGMASVAMHLAGDVAACGQFAERLVEVARKYDFQAPQAIGSFMLGAQQTLGDDGDSGLRRMESAFETALIYRFVGGYPGVVMADALARAGRPRDAMAVVMRVLDTWGTLESGVYVSELWRLRGELALAESAANAESSERFLRTAVRIASEQGAKIFHMRAAISFARLVGEQGRREEAKSVLEHAHAASAHDCVGSEVAAGQRLLLEL